MPTLAETLAKAKAITNKKNDSFAGPPSIAALPPQGGGSTSYKAPAKVVQTPYKEDVVENVGSQTKDTVSNTSLKPESDVMALIRYMNMVPENVSGMKSMQEATMRGKDYDRALIERFQPRVDLKTLGNSIDAIYSTKYGKTAPTYKTGEDLLEQLRKHQPQKVADAAKIAAAQKGFGDLFTEGPKTVFQLTGPQETTTSKTGVRPTVVGGGGSGGGGQKPPNTRMELEALNKDLKPFEEMSVEYENLEGILKGAGLPRVKNLREGMDIPGVGPLDRAKASLGGWIPGVGQRDAAFNQARQAVENIITKARSGAVVTDGEAARLREEFGQAWGNDAGMVRFLQKLRGTLKSGTERAFNARPQVFDYYRQTTTGKKLLDL